MGALEYCPRPNGELSGAIVATVITHAPTSTGGDVFEGSAQWAGW